MSFSSAPTSPDPLTASVPAPTRALKRSATRALAPRSNNVSHVAHTPQFSSPSKSFIMDTGAADGVSPWRIKVTVEAEPKDSPTKAAQTRTRTQKVPLKGGGSSSPVRRGRPRKKDVDVQRDGDKAEAEDVKRPRRKRKGTPIRRRNNDRKTASANPEENADHPDYAPEAVDDDDGQDTMSVSSPSKRPARSGPKKGSQNTATDRSKRLSRAREELDLALQEAVGNDGDAQPSSARSSNHRNFGSTLETDEKDDEDDEEDSPFRDAPGDMTVSQNEDFTMVSAEALQNLKANTSLLEESRIGDKSAASVTWMPSSPPVVRKATVEEQQRVEYPDITAQAEEAERAKHPDQSEAQFGAYDVMSWKATGPAKIASPFASVSGRMQEGEEPKNVDENEVQLRGYDLMSWKPTGPPKIASPPISGPERALPPNITLQRQSQTAEPKGWRLQREAVSKEIQGARSDQVIVIEDDADAGATDADTDGEGQAGAAESEMDIWAEEASRSLEEEQSHDSTRSLPVAAQKRNPPQLDDIFSDQSLKPLRSKIPRTWRRSSGMDFSYIDSPEHGVLPSAAQVGRGQQRQASGPSNGSRSDGVLTPPSSEEGGREQDGEDIELGDPDAAATQLQNDDGREKQPTDVLSRHAVEDAASTHSESSSSVTSPVSEGEDTGLFWQSNLPNVYSRERRRPRFHKQKAMDLSELLSRNKPSSAVKDVVESVTSTSANRVGGDATKHRSPLHMRPVDGAFKSSPSDSNAAKSKLVSSPLRKSLLKSSKVPGGPDVRPRDAVPQRPVLFKEHHPDGTEHGTSLDDGSKVGSFWSKASDQRQLLGEMATASSTKATRQSPGTIRQMSAAEGQPDVTASQSIDDISRGQRYSTSDCIDETSYSAGKDGVHETGYRERSEGYEVLEDELYSYEDIETPGHDPPTQSYEEHLNLDSPQKIKVNFNDSTGNSTLLKATKEYPPLFEKSVRPTALPAERPASPPTVTLVSKTSSSQHQRSGLISRLTTSLFSALLPSGPTTIDPVVEPAYSPSLRTQLRNRYGVLSDQQPWTMSHMRTLHRMLNSCLGKHDTIIPRSGPLPSDLSKLIGKKLQSVTDFKYTFTAYHAHTVDAFMQVLVPKHFVEAMKRGEVEFLGDNHAEWYRGQMGDRHGEDLVWGKGTGVLLPRGGVTREFVVKAVGNCVFANLISEKKEAEAGFSVDEDGMDDEHDVHDDDRDDQ